MSSPNVERNDCGHNVTTASGVSSFPTWEWFKVIAHSLQIVFHRIYLQSRWRVNKWHHIYLSKLVLSGYMLLRLGFLQSKPVAGHVACWLGCRVNNLISWVKISFPFIMYCLSIRMALNNSNHNVSILFLAEEGSCLFYFSKDRSLAGYEIFLLGCHY